MERVTVALGDAPYDVVIGGGVPHEIAGLLSDRRPGGGGLAEGHRRRRLGPICSPSRRTPVMMGDGEEAKSLETIDTLCRGS